MTAVGLSENTPQSSLSHSTAAFPGDRKPRLPDQRREAQVCSVAEDLFNGLIVKVMSVSVRLKRGRTGSVFGRLEAIRTSWRFLSVVEHRESRLTIPVLVIILPTISAGLGLMLQSTWGDEVYTLYAVHRSLLDAVRAPLELRNVPFYYFLAWFFTLRGESILGGRLLSLFAFMGSAYFLYLLTEKVLNRRTALWATLVFVFNPVMIWYAQDARMYAPWILLCLASLYYQLRAMETGRMRDLAVFGVVFFLGCLTHFYHIFFAAASGVALFLYRPQQYRNRVLVTLVLAVLAAAPLIVIVFVLQLGNGAYRESNVMGLAYLALTYAIGFSYGPTNAELHVGNPVTLMMPYLPGAIAAVLAFWLPVLFGAWRMLKAEPRKALMFVAFGIAVTVLPFAAAIISKGVNFNARYALPSLPFFVILLAYGLSTMSRRWICLPVVMVFGVEAAGLAMHYGDAQHWKEDYRGLVSYLKAEAQPEDRILFAPYPGYLGILLKREVSLLNPKSIQESLSMPGRHFCILNSPWVCDPLSEMSKKLRRAPGMQAKAFPGFDVFVLTVPPRAAGAAPPEPIPAGSYSLWRQVEFPADGP